MRYEYIEPLVATTIRVLDEVIHCDITRGVASLVRSDNITEDIAIIVKLRGDSEGGIVLGMPADTALRVCNALFGEYFETLTPEGMDAISELANMIAGNAAGALNDMGFDFAVSPPQLATRNDLTGKTIDVEAFQLPLFTEYGEIIINVALRTH